MGGALCRGPRGSDAFLIPAVVRLGSWVALPWACAFVDEPDPGRASRSREGEPGGRTERDCFVRRSRPRARPGAGSPRRFRQTRRGTSWRSQSQLRPHRGLQWTSRRFVQAPSVWERISDLRVAADVRRYVKIPQLVRSIIVLRWCVLLTPRKYQPGTGPKPSKVGIRTRMVRLSGRPTWTPYVVLQPDPDSHSHAIRPL